MFERFSPVLIASWMRYSYYVYTCIYTVHIYIYIRYYTRARAHSLLVVSAIDCQLGTAPSNKHLQFASSRYCFLEEQQPARSFPTAM